MVRVLTEASRRRSTLKVLELLRSDPDDGVRENAAQAIGHYFRRAEDEEALVAALDDPVESVRRQARSALGALRGEPPPAR